MAIVLNGPSSGGKSTLAKALRDMILQKRPERYEVVSIDDHLKMSPEETIYEDDVFEITSALCERASGIVRAGGGVIIDHVMTSERIYGKLREALTGCPVRLVRVTCSPELLRKRERERGDRCPGSAEGSLRYLYPPDGYDLTVDTGTGTPEENAGIIYDAFFYPAGSGGGTR